MQKLGQGIAMREKKTIVGRVLWCLFLGFVPAALLLGLFHSYFAASLGFDRSAHADGHGLEDSRSFQAPSMAARSHYGPDDIASAFMSPQSTRQQAGVRGRNATGDQVAWSYGMVGANSGGFSFERGLETGVDMTMDDADALVSHQDIPRVIDRFAMESAADLDADALSRIFRFAIDRSIAKTGLRVHLAGFACGLQWCIGTVEGGSALDYLIWRDVFALEPEVADVEVRAVTISEPDSSEIMRFVFFVDPVHQPKAY